MALEDKVKDIIVEQLGVNADQVTAEASFIEDLGADSLDTVELVMAFEEEFGAEIPDEDAEKLTTVGGVDGREDCLNAAILPVSLFVDPGAGR